MNKSMIVYDGCKNGVYRAKAFLDHRFLAVVVWDKASGEATYQVLPILRVGGYSWLPSLRHSYPLCRSVKTDNFGEALEVLKERINLSDVVSNETEDGATFIVLKWNGEENAIRLYTSKEELRLSVQYKGDSLEINAGLGEGCLVKNSSPQFISQDLITNNGKKVRLVNVI